MSTFRFSKPQHALRYARDVETVGRKPDALKALKWFLMQKHPNREWTQQHETLVLKYFDLCVEMKAPHDAKEGIYRYRMMTQHNNPATLHKAIMYLIDLALRQARDAQGQLVEGEGSAALDKIEDLEEEQTPEALLMSTMGTESSKDRIEREVLVPWVRHAWDTFRNVLDQLRNVAKLEETYHIVARKAFEFCKDFNRPVEFRKLCSQMRLHLRSWRTYQEMHSEVWSQETLERHISTKFLQLDYCELLELWTEGHRTVEDIHTMMQMTGVKPAPQLMARYYASLARIFWVSGNYLFHAYALFKRYTVSVATKGLLKSSEERTLLAASTVLASLCIPLFQSNASDEETFFKIDVEREKKNKLAQLLNFTSTPSRQSLMEELRARGVVRQVPSSMASLWDDLEDRFQPLTMTERVAPALEWVASQDRLKQYVASVERLLVQRVLEQLTRVYTTFPLDRFESMVAKLSLSAYEVEQLIVRAVRSRQLQVRVDHQGRALHLGEVRFESEHLRRQLSQLASGMRTVTDALQAAAAKPVTLTNLERRRTAAMRTAQETLPALQRAILVRKGEIEQRKEGAERVRELRIREEEQRKATAEAERAAAEAERLAEEQRNREQEKLAKLQEDEAIREKERLLRSAGRDLSTISREEIAAMDRDALETEIYDKERKAVEAEHRRREERSKRLDYLVRATRETEQQKLDTWSHERNKADESYVREQQRAIYERSKAKHEHSMSIKTRLVRALPYRSAFETQLEERRQAQYEQEKEERLAVARQRWVRDKLKRAAQRRREVEAAEHQRRLEELRREEEEKEEQAAAASQWRRADEEDDDTAEVTARRPPQPPSGASETVSPPTAAEQWRRRAGEGATSETSSKPSGGGVWRPRHLRGAEGASPPAPSSPSSTTDNAFGGRRAGGGEPDAPSTANEGSRWR